MRGRIYQTAEGCFLRMKSIGMKLVACFLASALVLFCPIFPHTEASAVTVAEAQAALNSAEAQMQAIAAEYEALEAEVAELQAKIDENAEAAMLAQQAVIEGRERLSQTVIYDYRSGMMVSLLTLLLSSNSLDTLISNVEYINQLMEYQADEIQAQKDRKAELDAISAELDAQKKEQVTALEELAAKQAEAEAVVAQASSTLANARAEEAARLAALQQAANQMQQRPNNGDDVEIDENANTTGRQDAVQNGTVNNSGNNGNVDSASGWLSGIASAYGGATDPYTPNPGVTATGAVCNDTSMGVAVPMAMPGYRSYFGRTVEIRYNGMTVYATVNDCGYMGGGSRVLDLQPGVWKAFGYKSCRAWGLRTVSYRFL